MDSGFFQGSGGTDTNSDRIKDIKNSWKDIRIF